MYTKAEILTAAETIHTDRVFTLHQRLQHKLEGDLQAALGAVKTKRKFIEHISKRNVVFAPTPHEQATLVCLEDVIQRRCSELDVSQNETTMLYEALQRSK